MTAVLYQRPGERQKLREALVDLRIWPSPREGLVQKLGYVPAALLQKLWRRDIEPLAGAGKVEIDDTRVWVLVRETLDQLFDRAAKHPWRKLPENQPIPRFVCDSPAPDAPPAPHVCPAGQLGRMRYKTAAQRKAEEAEREARCLHAAVTLKLWSTPSRRSQTPRWSAKSDARLP
jgi:hypothetical protein